MIRVGTHPADMPVGEINAYINFMSKQYPEIKEGVLDIVLFEDSDEVDLTLTEDPVRFQRIRRITGYLVGDLSRFNNAKLKEVKDRVKHGMGENINEI